MGMPTVTISDLDAIRKVSPGQLKIIVYIRRSRRLQLALCLLEAAARLANLIVSFRMISVEPTDKPAPPTCPICCAEMVPLRMECHDGSGWVFGWRCDCDEKTRGA